MPHIDALAEIRAALLGGDTLTNVQTGFLLAVLGSLDGAITRSSPARSSTTTGPRSCAL